MNSPFSNEKMKNGLAANFGRHRPNFPSQIESDIPQVMQMGRMNSQKVLPRNPEERPGKVLTARMKNTSDYRGGIVSNRDVLMGNRVNITPFDEDLDDQLNQQFEAIGSGVHRNVMPLSRKQSRLDRLVTDHMLQVHQDELSLDRRNNLYLRLQNQHSEPPAYESVNRRLADEGTKVIMRPSLHTKKELDEQARMNEPKKNYGFKSDNRNLKLGEDQVYPERKPGILDRLKRREFDYNGPLTDKASVPVNSHSAVFKIDRASRTPNQLSSPRRHVLENEGKLEEHEGKHFTFKPIGLFENKKLSMRVESAGSIPEKFTFGNVRREDHRAIPIAEKEIPAEENLSHDSLADEEQSGPSKMRKKESSKVDQIFEKRALAHSKDFGKIKPKKEVKTGSKLMEEILAARGLQTNSKRRN